MTFEKWLEAMGLNVADLSEDQKAKLEAKFKVEQAAGSAGNASDGGDVSASHGDIGPDAVVASVRAEQARQKAVTELVAEAVKRPGADLDRIEAIGKEAIANGWNPKDTELALLRATRSTAPRVSRNGAPPSEPVLAAMLLLACGVNDEKLAKDRDFGARVMEAAWPRRHGGMHQVFAAALAADGVSAPHGGEALYRAVMEHQLRAGFSTTDLPGVLGTVGNKLLQDSFTTVDAAYPTIAQQADFNNFLTYTIYRLDHTGEFGKVGQDGELKSGKLGEASFTNKLDTYGQMLTLTRQQIANDDLNALNQLYRTLGRKARIAVEKALFSIVMEAADVFYTGARGNRVTTNALSVTGLGAAEAAMLGMVDGDGDPIYAMPTILLVPPGLKATGLQLYTSGQVNQNACVERRSGRG